MWEAALAGGLSVPAWGSAPGSIPAATAIPILPPTANVTGLSRKP